MRHSKMKMTGRVLNIVLIAAFAAILPSCCKKRTFCNNEQLKVAFTGYDRSSVRTVILKRYMTGDKVMNKALDSAQLVNNTALTTVFGKPDTSWLSSYTLTSGSLQGITYGNDWIIYLPAINRTIRFTDIVEGDKRFEKVPCKDNDTKCTNSIKSYAIEGFWVESNTAYIKK